MTEQRLAEQKRGPSALFWGQVAKLGRLATLIWRVERWNPDTARKLDNAAQRLNNSPTSMGDIARSLLGSKQLTTPGYDSRHPDIKPGDPRDYGFNRKGSAWRTTRWQANETQLANAGLVPFGALGLAHLSVERTTGINKDGKPSNHVKVRLASEWTWGYPSTDYGIMLSLNDQGDQVCHAVKIGRDIRGNHTRPTAEALSDDRLRALAEFVHKTINIGEGRQVDATD